MGHEGTLIVVKKKVDQSSPTACNLLGGSNLRPTSHDGETLVNTGDNSIHQLSDPAELAITDPHLESMHLSIMQILKQLQDDKIYSVGIVGLAGSGKTFLAKEVAKKVKELNVFDLVIFIDVSRRSNEKEIQDQLAERLGLRWVTEDLRERAEQIFLRLGSGERILIILDDIWNRLNLQQIGIPSSNDSMGCKLLLTSRNKSVVESMECQFLFDQYELSEEAAWSLFRKWAGTENASLDPSIPDKGVAAMNMMLQDSERDFKTYILSLIDWSLSSKVERSLFLISSLFPEDEILIEHLSHYAITLGLCGKNEVNVAINNLIYHDLLKHNPESKDHVIMHDLIREVAQQMVEKENPAHRDSIRRYLMALRDWGSLSDSKNFQWEEELDRLLHQMFHVRKSSSISIIEPSRTMVNFKGLCQVDESFLPLLKEACKRYPQLLKCQAKHSKTFKQSAFNTLGQLLFMLNNDSIPNSVYDELKIYWDQALHMEFDLEWLKPVVDRVLSSIEIHRIEALEKEEEKWNAKAAKLRQQLNQVELEAAHFRSEIALLKPKVKLNGPSLKSLLGGNSSGKQNN